ncbi:MFS transporter [Clostridium felsineum]|uniref:Transporter n=1 Tax=Clostridium felsineum TaxID=36839 RepID=A0A1S8L243_9CLOT|nr:MFS transporter [Clostridium felsineum]MCR3758728.1 MFS transporter [Clostridium felsineum]URZ05281.1 putative transporter [Clostridium felsineum]URZ10322.1 putative transporter [Clostridium felsineum]
MTSKKSFELNKFIIFIMAVTCTFTVANLYYCQPLLGQIAKAFNVTEASAGFVVTLTQIGYAFGMFLLVPLGDIRERKKLILEMLLLVSIFLLVAFFSENYYVLLIAVFFIGFTTIIPQLIVPFAAHLSRPKERGQVIGNVMSGLLIGILLSRVFSGIIGDALGWRNVYLIASAMMIAFLLIIAVLFPKSTPISKISYKNLIFSMWGLIKREKVLREASINGALMFGSFSIFWTALVFLLESKVYNMGSKEAGFFGVVGIIGALAAPIVGKVADKKTPRFALGFAIIFSTIAYICFWTMGYKIYGLIIGVILLDLGNQTGQVSNQARIQAISDQERSRINTVFMVSYFTGGSIGSFISAVFWQMFGWNGVCLIGMLFQIIAIIFHFIIYNAKLSIKE